MMVAMRSIFDSLLHLLLYRLLVRELADAILSARTLTGTQDLLNTKLGLPATNGKQIVDGWINPTLVSIDVKKKGKSCTCFASGRSGCYS